MDVAASLRCDGVADLLDREDRGDRHGDCAGAELGALAWEIAYERWIDTANGDDFSELARRALGELQAASTLC